MILMIAEFDASEGRFLFLAAMQMTQQMQMMEQMQQKGSHAKFHRAELGM